MKARNSAPQLCLLGQCGSSRDPCFGAFGCGSTAGYREASTDRVFPGLGADGESSFRS